MKALVLTEYKKIQYTEVEKPVPAANEVLVRVKACGICGSDVMGYDGSTGRRQPPVVMGHEAGGVIEEVGADVTEWKVGDRVTFDSTIYCNECENCRHGDINLCGNRRVIGVSCDEYRRDGAFAEYIALPQHILYHIPDNVTFDQAAMIEPMSIAFHAANLIPHKLGATAAVVGCGKIGMLLIQTLRAYGYGTIIAVKHSESGTELIKELGADYCLTGKDNARERISEITNGKGVDVVFEAAGNEKTINLCIDICRRNGDIVLIGNTTPKITVPLQAIVTRQLKIHGSCASAGEYPACLDLIARGAVNVDKLIGHRVPLSEGAYWFEKLYSNPDDNLKVILNP